MHGIQAGDGACLPTNNSSASFCVPGLLEILLAYTARWRIDGSCSSSCRAASSIKRLRNVRCTGRRRGANARRERAKCVADLRPGEMPRRAEQPLRAASIGRVAARAVTHDMLGDRDRWPGERERAVVVWSVRDVQCRTGRRPRAPCSPASGQAPNGGAYAACRATVACVCVSVWRPGSHANAMHASGGLIR